MERLGRGVVAMRSAESQVYIGWRLLGTDPVGVAFNLYRATAGKAPARLNIAPLAKTPDFVDTTADLTASNQYMVRPVIAGKEQPASQGFTLAANAAVGQYLAILIQQPPGGTSPDERAYTYNANDASVGDLDGDGEYEIVLKWDPSNARDNSQPGYTGSTIFDAYRMDGTSLWRIDLGRNIRSGAHYTQLLVYDFDGDGKAEIAIRTSDGTIDGAGKVLGDAKAEWVSKTPGPTLGKVLTGPEYVTIFDGMTGAARRSRVRNLCRSAPISAHGAAWAGTAAMTRQGIGWTASWRAWPTWTGSARAWSSRADITDVRYWRRGTGGIKS
jgi:rhamnogalacturonan endolyase